MANAEALLLAGDKRKEAVAAYEKCLEYKPDHWEAHHGIAVNLLHAEDSEDMGMSGPERKRKALLHAKKAFELAGPSQLKAVDMLTDALAHTGKVQEGLNVLLHAYKKTGEEKTRQILEKRIGSFRSKHGLGKLWQFFSPSGKKIFESTDINEIRGRLISGTLPYAALCQKNQAGKRGFIKDLLVPEEPAIEVSVCPYLFHAKYGALVGGCLTGGVTGLWYIIQFLAYYGKALPGAFVDFVQFGLQNIFAFVAAIILLGLPTLGIALFVLLAVIAVIGAVTGFLGAIPGGAGGALLGLIVGAARAPFIPKIGPGGPEARLAKKA
jgi:hypothetical protein